MSNLIFGWNSAETETEISVGHYLNVSINNIKKNNKTPYDYYFVGKASIYTYVYLSNVDHFQSRHRKY